MGNSKERVCAIYTRISTEEQAKKGYSLSEQKKRLTDYCEYNDFIIYNYHKNNYYKNKHSLTAMFLYFIFRIKTYEKSPRNFPISEEMKKEINKMELYNLEIRFMDENRIDSYEDLHCYKVICKEALDDLIYARKRTYEEKSKSKNNHIKDECDMKIDFYNESIKDFQTKIKTCNTIEENNKKIIKWLEQIDRTKDFVR